MGDAWPSYACPCPSDLPSDIARSSTALLSVVNWFQYIFRKSRAASEPREIEDTGWKEVVTDDRSEIGRMKKGGIGERSGVRENIKRGNEDKQKEEMGVDRSIRV